MPSANRRSVLAALGTVALGGVSGCRSIGSEDPPAGSLRFENEHDVPHAITMRVTDVGTAPGGEPGTVEGETTAPLEQRTRTASTVVDPGETQTYETVFTEPVWYAVQFTVDGREPEDDTGLVTWNPAPDRDEDGSLLSGKVYASGEFSWVVIATDDPGRFEQ